MTGDYGRYGRLASRWEGVLYRLEDAFRVGFLVETGGCLTRNWFSGMVEDVAGIVVLASRWT